MQNGKQDKDMVQVIAIKAVGVEMSDKERLEFKTKREARGRDGNTEGLTKMVYPGDKPFYIPREVAKKLQKAKAIEIVL